MAARLLPLLLLALTVGCDSGRKHRIVLITLDTLRYDSLEGDAGCMPNTLALARTGLRFEDFYAASSSTQPTHASLFTGLHPWQHGVTRNGMILTEDKTTVAELLAELGFENRAVVASFPLHADFGFAQGFDHYDDAFVEDVTSGEADPRWNDVPLEDRKFHSLARTITDRAIAALDAATTDRQFFWFHYYDPHAPYGDARKDGEKPVGLPRLLKLADKGAEDLDASIAEAKAAYDRDVRFLDEQLARLFSHLKQGESRHETHIVITSDHGESFGEDGSLGHGRRVSRPQIHVPLVITGPGIPAATRRTTTGTVDLARTLIALAGEEDITLPDSSRSVLEESASGHAFGMRRTFVEESEDVRRVGGSWQRVPMTAHRFFTIREGSILSGDATALRNEDAPDDPVAGETTSLLRTAFKRFEEELSGNVAPDKVDEHTRKALEELGYVP